MRALPNDLVPLPTMPYSERPLSLPLDIEECRTAIWRAAGNITKAAEILKVPSRRLRKFVKDSPYLSGEIEEAAEQLVDKAEDIIADALEDTEDKGRQDAAARLVLQSARAKARGWGNGTGAGNGSKVSVAGDLIIQWGNGENINPLQTIEGEVIEDE